MARARNIKPGFYKNEDLAECSIWARFIFPGLWMLADREGRLEDRPKRIKAELLAFDSHDVDPLLNELQGRGFLIRYRNEDGAFIQISKFLDHQNPHYSEKDSVIKPPKLPEHSGKSIEQSDAGIPGEPRESSESEGGLKRGSQPPDSLIPDSLNPESKPSRASRFDEFWSVYPKKKSKAHAEKAWLKIKPDEQLHATILSAVKRATTSADWQKDGGQFIPHPATWLNARGWEDEIAPAAAPAFVPDV